MINSFSPLAVTFISAKLLWPGYISPFVNDRSPSIDIFEFSMLYAPIDICDASPLNISSVKKYGLLTQ